MIEFLTVLYVMLGCLASFIFFIFLQEVADNIFSNDFYLLFAPLLAPIVVSTFLLGILVWPLVYLFMFYFWIAFPKKSQQIYEKWKD